MFRVGSKLLNLISNQIALVDYLRTLFGRFGFNAKISESGLPKRRLLKEQQKTNQNVNNVGTGTLGDRRTANQFFRVIDDRGATYSSSFF